MTDHSPSHYPDQWGDHYSDQGSESHRGNRTNVRTKTYELTKTYLNFRDKVTSSDARDERGIDE